MFRRRERYAALLTTLVALVAAGLAGRLALVPCGFVAGIVVGMDPDASADGVAVVSGARAGALGAVLVVLAFAAIGFVRLTPIVGPAYAVDWSLFTGFAMAPLLLPLYVVEGAVAPLVARSRSAARTVGSRPR